MAIQSILFKTGPFRSGNGFPLPGGVDIPVVDACGRNEMIRVLDDALNLLADTPCSFWACEGPEKPEDMKTCSKCWAMISIASVKMRLENDNNQLNSIRS